MKWYGYLGIGLLGAGIGVSHSYEATIGLIVFAVGVVLAAFGVKEKHKEVTTST